MVLNKADIAFLAKRTNLSQKKVKLLTEDPRDLALVLDALTTAKVSKEEILSLSFEVIIKYVIFKFSHHLDYDISEKLYICEMISKYFPYISRSDKLKPLPINLNKDFAEYCFVLTGLFKHRLNKKQSTQYDFYTKFFRDSEFPQLYNHLKEWYKICEQIKTQEIFV